MRTPNRKARYRKTTTKRRRLSRPSRSSSAVDPTKIGHPHESILARKRESLIAALSLGHPENPMIAGVIDRDGAVVVEDQPPGLGEVRVTKVILCSYRTRPS
jgi:hypothetical protein